MPSLQAPTLNSLNNAVVVMQSQWDPKRFTDLNSIYANYTRDSFTTYKGLLSLWNQRSIVNTPLMKMTQLQNNVMYVNNTDGRFRYGIPYDIGFPEVVEDMEPDVDKVGLDGQPFKIKLTSGSGFTNTDRITVDYMDGIELYIGPEEIYPEEDGDVFHVQIVNKNRKGTYYPKAWLQPGVQYMKVSNINDEYDTQKSSITTKSGFLQLEQELGGGERSVTHWITGYADMLRLEDSKLGAGFASAINQKLSSMGSTIIYANRDANGNVLPQTIKWQRTVELLCRVEMEKMQETDLMWGKGGFVDSSGRRKVKVPVGLYEQLRNGNRYLYNKISLDLIESAIGKLFINSGIPVQQRKTKIMTGSGGLQQISKEIQARATQLNSFVTQAKDIPGGFYFGDQDNAGFRLPRFTQYFSPLAGLIQFELNEALDAVTGNRVADSKIGDWPHSSFAYMIMDVTDSGSTNAAQEMGNNKVRVADGFNNNANVVLVKPESYGDTYWGYIIGTHSPSGPAAMNGMTSSSHRNGYELWMRSFGAIWLKDSTRTLLIEKARPNFTGETYN